MERAQRLGIIILAAGESSRLGFPKQLARIRGETLLAKAARDAFNFTSDNLKSKTITIVLGAYSDEITNALSANLSRDCKILVNAEWKSGVASSIRCGISNLPEDTDAAMLAICDQPLITSLFLTELFDTFILSQQGIAASLYDNSAGVPAIFARKYFKELTSLAGDVGAKQLLNKRSSDLALCACPAAKFDIDTPEDYLYLKELSQNIN